MASFLEMDIKDLFSRKKKDPDTSKNNKGKQSSLDKTVIKRIIIGTVLILLVLCTYYFYVKPTLNNQKEKLAQVETWQQQIQSCISEINNLNESINQLKSENELKGVLFVSDDEFENFYAEITEATVRNGLKIINITRGEEVPVRVSDDQENETVYKYVPVSTSIPCEQNSQYQGLVNNSSNFQPDPNCQGDECKPIAYYKMTVSYEIEGGFSNYVNFRNVLANKAKIVNIEAENIKKSDSSGGLITATATVSLVKGNDL